MNVKTSAIDAEVEVEVNDTLATLKRRIAEATGEPENDITLRFAGKNLSANLEKTVGDALGGADYIQAEFKSTMNINNAAGGARRRSRRARKASRKSPRKSRKASRKSPRKASRKSPRKSRKASRKNRRMYY
jgi:hypothetical protein